MATHWHILRVTSGFEEEARSRLFGAGVECYVPMGIRFRHCRRYRKTVSVDFPLIPGYVFVATAEPILLRGIAGSSSRGFLRNGDRSYAVLSDTAHRELLRAEHNARWSAMAEWESRRLKPSASFGVGDVVSIPSMGVRGEITKVGSSSYAIRVSGLTIRVGLKKGEEALELLAA